MRLLIIGHKGSGKTHIGALLSKQLGVQYMDSSGYCFDHVVYPSLKEKYGYQSKEEAMADKDNRREDWFQLIAEYNTIPDRLTLEILKDHNIYVGMRNRREFEGSHHHFDLRIWIDASERIADESIKSMELSQSDAQYILDNNGSKEDLLPELAKLLNYIDTIRP